MTTRHATDNAKALAAYLAAKAEIDAMLVRLAVFSEGHFDVHPDEVNWGHVGTLCHYAGLLRQITDSAYSGGKKAG